jgi:ribonuclease P protein component
VARARSSTQKTLIQNVFDKGEKLIFKSFIAFFIFSNQKTLAIIASKKIGNAVKRNFAKRRLRNLSHHSEINAHLVLLARANTINFEFTQLSNDWNSFIKLLERKREKYLNIADNKIDNLKLDNEDGHSN